MKLIDLLVQELAGKGGWSSAGTHCVQDSNGQIWFFHNGTPFYERGVWAADSESSTFDWTRWGIYLSRSAKDHSSSIVTREQYEAALVASQQPAWDGEGVPPVGIKCLTIGPHGDDSWYECKIIAHTVFSGRKVAVFQYGDTISHSSAKWFKPLPAKAESHREAAVKKISEIGFYLYDEDLTSAGVLYDAIASGKIPGVKLEADHE